MKLTIIRAFMILAVAALVAAPNAAAGSPSASGVVRVRVTVVPEMAVMPIEATVDAGQIRTGAFSVTSNYQVRSNVPDVQIFVEQSPLFMIGDPNGKVVAPIPVSTAKGVSVQPVGGNVNGGRANTLAFVGSGVGVAGFPTLKTETVMFSSSRAGVFSQQVGVTCWWEQADSQKPPGEYSGVVRLTAFSLPTAGG